MAKAFEKATWIWRQGAAGKDEFCDFLDTVTAKAGEHYTLRIASDSNYTVWMNGELCVTHVVPPGMKMQNWGL